MAALLAPDYRDRWQQDKATLLGRSREAFGSFALLTIGHELRGLRAEAGSFSISEKITIKGIGAPSAMAVRETVNALREPFTMEWRRRNEKPWDWELKSVAQPELELP